MIRKFISLCFISLFAFTALQAKDAYLFSCFVGNDGLHLAYSEDGLTWTALHNNQSYVSPQVGKDKLMRDPSICQGPDGTFHLVWTTGWWDQIIGHASSKDLINWSEQESIPVMEHEPTTRNTWAPELFYDARQKLFFIFWASTIPDRHSPVQTIESEAGLNHRLYYVTTKDFKTFSETKIFFNPTFSVIDGAVIQKDKMYYMVLKNENSLPAEKNIRITSAKKMGDGFDLNVSEPITGNYWAEGPAPLQVGDYVYVYFDKYREHKYGAVRSKDMKNWEDVSDLVSFPRGIRHGTAFRVDESVLKALLEAQ